VRRKTITGRRGGIIDAVFSADGEALPLRRDEATGDRADAGVDCGAVSISRKRFLMMMESDPQILLSAWESERANQSRIKI